MKNSKENTVTMSIEALDNIKFNSRYKILDVSSIILLIDVSKVLDKTREYAGLHSDIKLVETNKNTRHSLIKNIDITPIKYSEEAVFYTDEYNTLLTNNNNILQL